MKFVFLAVLLIAAFMVDCRSQPGLDSQHSIIAEQTPWPDLTLRPEDSENNNSEEGTSNTVEPPDDPEETTSITDVPPMVPGFTLGSDDSEETTLITDVPPPGPGFAHGSDNSEETTSITDVPPMVPGFTLGSDDSEETTLITDVPPLGPDFTLGHEFDIEEKEDRSESELRGSSCKAKLPCSIPGGYCVNNATLCKGRLVADGCKGSCQCCIPECSEDQGFFRSPGSFQCFKLFTDRGRSWTSAVAHCQANGMVLAHPSNAVSLRNYIVETFGHKGYPWLNARGSGSYFKWQDNSQGIANYDPLWYPGHPGNSLSSSYCMILLTHSHFTKYNATSPYWQWTCSTGGGLTLCELKM